MRKMKKLIGLLVFVATFYMGIVVVPEIAKADEMENLVFGEKYDINLEDGDYTEHNGKYVFNVTLSSSGRIDIKFIADNSNGESRVQLFDETDSSLVKGDFTGSYSGYTDLKAGNYKLVITAPYSWSDGAKGIFTVTYTDAEETYKENAVDTNDQYGAASFIKSVKNETIKGQLAVNDDVDYYKFRLTKAQKLTLTFKSALKGVELHLYNSELDYEMRCDLESGTNVYTKVLPASTYYVSFTNKGGKSALGNYTLKLKTSDLKETSIKSLVSPAVKNVKVKWKKASSVSGYQIQIATNSKFTKNKKSYSTTNTSYTIKKLKSKKTYYVRIRTYTIADNNEKCYSDWCKAKKIKVK